MRIVVVCRLEANVVTPTTKAADHDEPISPRDIVERGLMLQAEWDQVGRRAQAQAHASRLRAGAWMTSSGLLKGAHSYLVHVPVSTPSCLREVEHTHVTVLHRLARRARPRWRCLSTGSAPPRGAGCCW